MTVKQSAIIIGAGIGGLTAAIYLARQGFLVQVLEGRSETGGLASGFTLGNSCCTMRGGRFAELNKTQLFARLLATDLVINVSNTFWSTSASFLM